MEKTNFENHRMTYFNESQKNSSRDKWARNCSPYIDYVFMGDKDSWDTSSTAYTKDGKIKFTANNELKDRDIDYGKYSKWGFMIERKKQKPLMYAFKKTGSIPFLIIYFRDNIGWACNLTKIDWTDVKWKWRLCTKTTAEGTYGEEKEWKEVFDIPANKGIIFKYE